MRLFTRHEMAVLMVCTANICRSPMAEGLLRRELEARGLGKIIFVDSAGTHVGQVGHPADPRAQKVCNHAGIDLRRCKARQIRDQDFDRFDHILAMDLRNKEWLIGHCPPGREGRIALLGSCVGEECQLEIPDPYFGNLAGFERVLDLLFKGVEGFMRSVIGNRAPL